MRHAFIAILTSALMAFPAIAQALPEIGKPAPDFTAKAVDGATVKPSDFKGKIVVIEWNNPLCPFVRKHYGSGNMQKLQAYANSKKVVWLTVNSSGPDREGNMNVQQAKDYIATNKLTVTHYLLDPDGTIGKLYGAKATPHMFVIDTNGNLAYKGAIDDKPTPDPATVDGAQNYVRVAIDSLLAGQPVAVASTQAYGCSVKYAE